MSADGKDAAEEVKGAESNDGVEEKAVGGLGDLPKTTTRLVPHVTVTDNSAEVFCVRFSHDGKFLAAGCGDGAIRVFNTTTGRMAYNLQLGSAVALPTTAIRFRPITANTKTRNVLIATNASGLVQHWHVTSGKCLHTITDAENQVYALDYNLDGTQFVTAGKDKVLRLYDEATKTCISEMQGGMGYGPNSAPGHSNRIFSVKCHPTDPNVILSSGWDNTVQFWDIRDQHATRSIFGPHICGDALDIVGNEILTGSWRPENALEVWDYSTGDLIETVNWSPGLLSTKPCMLYTAQFSKGSTRYIAAGGSGSNEAKVFDHHNGNQTVGTVTSMSRGVFTVDFSPDNRRVAIGGGDSSIRLIDIVESVDVADALNIGGEDRQAADEAAIEAEQKREEAEEDAKDDEAEAEEEK